MAVNVGRNEQTARRSVHLNTAAGPSRISTGVPCSPFGASADAKGRLAFCGEVYGP